MHRRGPRPYPAELLAAAAGRADPLSAPRRCQPAEWRRAVRSLARANRGLWVVRPDGGRDGDGRVGPAARTVDSDGCNLGARRPSVLSGPIAGGPRILPIIV